MPLVGTPLFTPTCSNQWSILQKYIDQLPYECFSNNTFINFSIARDLLAITPRDARQTKEAFKLIVSKVSSTTTGNRCHYTSNLTINLKDPSADPLLFADWGTSKAIRFFLTPYTTVRELSPPQNCSPIHPIPNGVLNNVFSLIHNMIIPPNQRNKIFRLLHGRIPRCNLGIGTCHCPDHPVETTTYLLGSCPETEGVRKTIWQTWLRAISTISDLLNTELGQPCILQLQSFPLPDTHFWELSPFHKPFKKSKALKKSKVIISTNLAWQLVTSAFIQTLWLR
ncbi:hypothetical protein H4219_006421 [Mycoemilia scoparia]|uniref:Reverse transcriptase n=1 Tax=Mycoemilia scoparia TaxID=417184 RepID=A0A9W7ZNN6_9FUNG|nr:hypothetical protein H4219_006421 [Mycoemilia scoparia]